MHAFVLLYVQNIYFLRKYKTDYLNWQIKGALSLLLCSLDWPFVVVSFNNNLFITKYNDLWK